jgi:hypothetical protein
MWFLLSVFLKNTLNVSGLPSGGWEVFGEENPGSAGLDFDDGGGAGVAGEEAQGVATAELQEGAVFYELAAEQFEMECGGLVSPLPEDGNQLSVGEDLGTFSASGGGEHCDVVADDTDAEIRVELALNHDSGEGLFGVEEEQASLNDGGMGFGAAGAEEGYESVVVSGGGNYESGVSGADGGADGLTEAFEQGGVIFVKEEGVAGRVRRRGRQGRVVVAGSSYSCAHRCAST